MSNVFWWSPGISGASQEGPAELGKITLLSTPLPWEFWPLDFCKILWDFAASAAAHDFDPELKLSLFLIFYIPLPSLQQAE